MERRAPWRQQSNAFFDFLSRWQDTSSSNRDHPEPLSNGKPESACANGKAPTNKRPTVRTDKSVYGPSETVIINTEGFKPGTTITFSIADASRALGKDPTKSAPSFKVTDGGNGDLDGKTDGKVQTGWQQASNPQGGSNTFRLTARGSDRQAASTTWNSSTPSVSTDKPDYKPGETASITANGFASGSPIEFAIEIISAPGRDGVYGTADDVVNQGATRRLAGTPWQVKDGTAADLDPSTGKVRTTWLVDPNALNTTLRLTATGFGADQKKGTADDQVATTIFTDAAGSFSKPYAHWSDEPLPGDWNNNILNDAKSNYFEGEVIPHVFMYGASNKAPLTKGQSYSFNVTYNYYQQNTDAGGFAYMTQYNLSRQPTVFDWATPAITPSGDSVFSNGGGMAAGANFYTVDADITNVSAVTYTGTGTKDGVVTITFTYTGTTTTNGYAAIYYGLYVAKPGEVTDQGKGKTDGASSWTGGSLQTTVDIGGSGATSLQLAPSAVIAGEISGLKFNDLNGNGSKDTNEPGLAGWTIILDTDSNPSNGFQATATTSNGTTDDQDGNGSIDPSGFYYFSVTPGTYYVYEVNQAGWAPTAPVSPSYYGPLVVSATTPTYLNKNFGNQQTAAPASVTIHKYVSVDGGKSWDDANTTTGPFLLSGFAQPQFKFVVENDNAFAVSGITLSDDTFTIDPSNNSKTITLPTLAGSDGTEGSGPDTYTLIYTGATWQAGQHTDTATIVFPIGGGATDTANDPANYFGATPSLTINKVTVDGATAGDGLNILAEESITWKYTIQNTGNVLLTNIKVVDDQGTPGNTADDVTVGIIPTLAVGASTTLTLLGTAVAGPYNNIGKATSTYTDTSGNTSTVSASDPSSYFGANPAISIDKVTVDGLTSGDGLNILTGNSISWTYTVKNTGNVALSSVTLNDAPAGAVTSYTGDTNSDGKLDTSETWVFTLNGTAIAGPYANTGTVQGSYTDSDGQIRTVSASDPSSYFGANPAISIDKVTVDGLTSGDGLNILTGNSISWTYTVKNTGNVALSSVTLNDAPAGAVTSYTGDTNSDGKLDTSETWIFTLNGTAIAGSYANTGTVQGSYTDSDGQIRTVSASDPSSYFGANPAISIDKVTVDGLTSGDGLNILTGNSISWTYTVKNTGNVALSSVTLNDAPAGAVTSYTGDTNSDGKLDTSETWVFTLNGTAIAGPYANTGTVQGSYTDSDGQIRTVSASDPSSYFGANPAISIDKVTKYGSLSGDNLTGVIAGQPIQWSYLVTNTGNVTLSNVKVVDDNGTPGNTSDDFTVGTIASLLVGGSATLTHSGIAIAGSYQNTGTATGSYTDSAGHTRTATASDTSSYTGTTGFGLIAPTNTTIEQYISGTSPTFQQYYSTPPNDLGGVIQYNVKTNGPPAGRGIITSTNPGVFYYRTGLSNGILPGVKQVLIDQAPGGMLPAFSTTFNNVKLYRISDLDKNGIDAGDGVAQQQLQASQVSLLSGGDVLLQNLNLAAGSASVPFYYVVEVKYDTSSVVGSNVGLNPTLWPTINYAFGTDIGNNSSIDETATGGITIAPKFSALTLSGEATIGGEKLTDDKLTPLVDAAIRYWADQGVSDADLNKLSHADMIIGDLGGTTLSGTDDITIFVDDDAAGHGWSVSSKGVEAGKVDLFSAVVHEFGHMLGYGHDVMGASLAVDERHLPFAPEQSNNDPLPLVSTCPTTW